jgi:A nuclease family of the HNH/ENDO VII superfamily with conserved AHH
MKAEEFAYINPYQFGGNNPVMFNDPMGDRFGGRNGERGNQMEVNPMNDTWSYSSYSGGFGPSIREGNYFSFWESLYSQTDANVDYFSMDGASGFLSDIQGYNYRNESGSGAFMDKNYIGDVYFSRETKQNYYFSNYGAAFDFKAMAVGYKEQRKTAGDILLDVVHITLDIASFIPVINIAASGINAGIYALQGDFKNAALSAASMIPFEKYAAVAVKYGGTFIGGIFKQSHHLIPNQIFRENKTILKSIGWIQSHNKNLMDLPVPFHGNHPSYNNFVRTELSQIISNKNLNDIIKLQNRMRNDIQNILNSGGSGNLNDFYKALGY